MAKLRITERKFNTVAYGGAYPIEGDFVASQELEIGTQVVSSEFQEETEYVSIFAHSNCYFAIGTNPTAVDASTEFLAMGERVQRAVNKGFKISVVAASD